MLCCEEAVLCWLFFSLTDTVGDRLSGCFHGAGMFPGRSFAVHSGSHGYDGGHGMHRANPGFPRHHLLRLYRSDPTWQFYDSSQLLYIEALLITCVLVWRCRSPRVPDVRAVWAHHSAGADAHSRHYEGKDFFCLSTLSSPSCSPFRLSLPTLSTSLLIVSQFVMAVLVLSVILPPGSRHIRWIVSAGLAQVSEFSFVLSSRARRASIISREVSDD